MNRGNGNRNVRSSSDNRPHRASSTHYQPVPYQQQQRSTSTNTNGSNNTITSNSSSSSISSSTTIISSSSPYNHRVQYSGNTYSTSSSSSNFRPSHYSNKRSNQSYHGQRTKTKKLDFDGIEIEELNEYLGYPDMYQVDAYGKYSDGMDVPEWQFTAEYIKTGYCEVPYRRTHVHQYGTFVSKVKASDFQKFIEELKTREASLRGDWKTFSTRKIREERKLLLENAIKSCQCEKPKIGFPELTLPVNDSEAVEQWMHELASRNSYKTYIPLRELASHLPQGIKKENVIPLLARHQVPFLRAVWFIKLLLLNFCKENDIDLSQIWTDMLLGFLNEQTSPQNISSFSKHDIKYLIYLISWCSEEQLINHSAIENWFITKCGDVISANNLSVTSSGVKRSNKTNFDQIFSRYLVPNIRYYEALDQCAEMISQKTCAEHLKITLLHFIKMLRKQSDPSQFFYSINELVSRERFKKDYSITNNKLHIIETLDKFSRNGSLDRLYSTLLKKKDLSVIPIICEWGYTTKRFEYFRRYVISSIICRLLDENPELITHVQKILCEVLNSSKMLDSKTIRNLYYQFADFIQMGIFSLEQYIDLVISRGLLSTDDSDFHCACILNLPFSQSASNYLKTRRKIALYGVTFSSNKQSNIEDQQIQNYFDTLKSMIYPSEKKGTNTSSSLIDTLFNIRNTLPVNNVFAISEKLSAFLKELIKEKNSSSLHYQLASEGTIDRIIIIFTELEDYRQLQAILECIVQYNTNYGEQSEWTAYEPLLCRIVHNLLPLYLATDKVQFVSKVLLSQCKKDSKQSSLEICRRKVTEEYLKYLNMTYPEVFWIDAFKKDFPHLSIFLDGLATAPISSSYNSTADMEDFVPISPNVQLACSSISGLFMEHFYQVMKHKEQLNSLQAITAMLNSFINKNQLHLSSVIFGSKKEIYPLLCHCLEHFDVENPYVISILREMMLTGCFFNNNDFYDMLSHIAGEKFANAYKTITPAKSMSQFLILCVTHNLISFEILATGIMKSLFGQTLKKLLTSERELSQAQLGMSFTVLWFARILSVEQTVIDNVRCPKLYNLMKDAQFSSADFVIHLPEVEKAALSLAKKNFDDSHIPNFIKILGDFCNRTVQRQNGEKMPPAFSILSETSIELYDTFISQEDILKSLACRARILHKCFEAIYERFPSTLIQDDRSNVSYRQFAIASIIYNLLHLIDDSSNEETRKILESYFVMPQPNLPITLPSVQDAIQFLKDIGGYCLWSFWYDAFFVNSFLFHMKRKTEVDSEQLNKSLYQPLLQTTAPLDNAEFKQMYSYIILHLVKHSSKLKNSICDQFFSLLKKLHLGNSQQFQFTKEENELWIQNMNSLSIVVIGICRTDASIAKKTCESLCESIRQLLKVSNIIPLFSKDANLSTISDIQLRLITSLNMLNTLVHTCHFFNLIVKSRSSSTDRSAVIKSVLDLSFQVIDHKLGQASFTLYEKDENSNYITSMRIINLVRNILNEVQERIADLQADEQHKLREQIANFCAQKSSAPSFTSKMTNILHNDPIPKGMWALIEDYVANCSECGAIHGHITANIFNGRIQERKNHIYSNILSNIIQGGLALQPDNIKKKRDRGLAPNPYSTPSPSRSPRNGVLTPTQHHTSSHR